MLESLDGWREGMLVSNTYGVIGKELKVEAIV